MTIKMISENDTYREVLEAIGRSSWGNKYPREHRGTKEITLTIDEYHGGY